MTTGKNVNVAVAAYVTTQAQLKLYQYLSKLGKSVSTVIQTRLSTFRMWMKPQKLKQGIF